MKPDWDALAKEYEGSETVLIADVDCTADGRPLCEKYKVSGYPTLMTFTSASATPKSYDGGRSLSRLREHVSYNGKQPPMSWTVTIAIGLVSVFVIYIGGQVARLW